MATERPTLLAPELMARVRQIQVRTHRQVSNALSGAYRSTFRGTGLEFEEVRPYQPGDDTRSIDWNVTARTGEPFIKTYREERQLSMQFLVDTSRSMDFGSGETTKRETAAEFCALLSFVAAREHDQVGLTLFADEPGLHLPPAKGSSHVLRVVREVIAAPPGGRGSSLVSVLQHQLRVLRKRSLLFCVSDFLDTEGEEWVEVLTRAARTHDVICVRVFDPLEERLPAAGLVTMRDIESGRLVDVDTRSRRVRAAWESQARERRERIFEALRRARTDTIELSTHESTADPVVRFFRQRAMRGGGA